MTELGTLSFLRVNASAWPIALDELLETEKDELSETEKYELSETDKDELSETDKDELSETEKDVLLCDAARIFCGFPTYFPQSGGH